MEELVEMADRIEQLPLDVVESPAERPCSELAAAEVVVLVELAAAEVVALVVPVVEDE